MSRILDKEQIIRESEIVFRQFAGYCILIPPSLFFKEPATGKWSMAQNLAHLIVSLKMTVAAYALPKFLVRWVGGKPNRASRTYEQLVAKYQYKLSEGGKAQGRYIPKKIPATVTKEYLLRKWQKVNEDYLAAIKKNWTNEQLDQYIVKHPLLGKITLRELCYFTIYHTHHHLDIIKARNADYAN